MCPPAELWGPLDSGIPASIWSPGGPITSNVCALGEADPFEGLSYWPLGDDFIDSDNVELTAHEVPVTNWTPTAWETVPYVADSLVIYQNSATSPVADIETTAGNALVYDSGYHSLSSLNLIGTVGVFSTQSLQGFVGLYDLYQNIELSFSVTSTSEGEASLTVAIRNTAYGYEYSFEDLCIIPYCNWCTINISYSSGNLDISVYNDTTDEEVFSTTEATYFSGLPFVFETGAQVQTLIANAEVSGFRVANIVTGNPPG